MAKVRNTQARMLGLPDGTLIKPGETVEVNDKALAMCAFKRLGWLQPVGANDNADKRPSGRASKDKGKD